MAARIDIQLIQEKPHLATTGYSMDRATWKYYIFKPCRIVQTLPVEGTFISSKRSHLLVI